MPSIFGGNSFGKPIPMQQKSQGQGGAIPVVRPGQPQGQQLGAPPGVVQSGYGHVGVVPPPPAGSVMGPQGPVPMGKPGECPICRG